MLRYIDSLSIDTKMYRSTMYNWLNIGEAYIKHREELDRIGFSENDGPTKLPYIKRALENRESDEVFDSIKNMTLNEFIDFSRGEAQGAKRSRRVPYIEIRGNVVYLKGKRAIIVSTKIRAKIQKYFLKVISVACKALDKGGRIVPVHVRNKKESERFKQVYSRVMAEVRKGK